MTLPQDEPLNTEKYWTNIEHTRYLIRANRFNNKYWMVCCLPVLNTIHVSYIQCMEKKKMEKVSALSTINITNAVHDKRFIRQRLMHEGIFIDDNQLVESSSVLLMFMFLFSPSHMMRIVIFNWIDIGWLPHAARTVFR